MQPTENFSGNDYWAISNFVDHGLAQDYMCYNRSYLGNSGTDYFLWPHPWNMMDNEEVAIIAAAPGMIVDKYDGNYDRQCSWTGAEWNAVYIRHSDGSTALYGHMKSGSTTPKFIGDTVERGEYLGLVGSSGNSIRPHLHFEVRDSSWLVVDPYQGSCNAIEESHWQDQHAYREPALHRGGLYGLTSWFMDCPQQNILNYRNNFNNGDKGFLVGYFRDILPQNTISFQSVNPVDNMVTNLATINLDDNYTSFWYWYGGTLTGDDNPGEYIFRILLDGEAYDFPYYWELNGCTDPTASNYNPDAMFDDGSCFPCNNGSEIKIILNFDDYSTETWWGINDANNINNYLSGGDIDGDFSSAQYCAEPGTYQITIYDEYGDGMCCDWGTGGYSILVDGVLVAEGGQFEYEDVNTIVIGGGTNETLEVTYNSGWNLVGLPIELENSDYEYLFPNIYSGTLYSFDGSYIEVENLINGSGYWLRFQEQGEVEFSGMQLNESSVNLLSGWNLVSGPSQISTLYDPNGLVYDGTIYGFDVNYINSDIFEPGKGYWLRSSDDGVITLSQNLARLDNRGSIREQYISQSSKISFLNSNGNAIDLYIGDNIPEEDIPMFSVPPLPPSINFDVRFSNDTKFCSDNECIIEIINKVINISFQFSYFFVSSFF